MKPAFSVIIAFLLFAVAASDASGQRDYLTEEEVELIRDTQQIDKRIIVLTKAIDRRFSALKVDVGSGKSSSKNTEEWGVLPESTRFELLLDIKRILQKAIDDIDSLAERPTSLTIAPDDKKPKGYAELFPLAVRNLAAAARRYRPVLAAELDRSKDKTEIGSILDALESCDEIIASLVKLAPEPVKKN